MCPFCDTICNNEQAALLHVREHGMTPEESALEEDACESEKEQDTIPEESELEEDRVNQKMTLHYLLI